MDPTLDQLVADIEKKMRRPECNLLDVPPLDGAPMSPDFWKADYYRALAAYSLIAKPERVLEIGRRYGHSSWALARGAGEVHSCDVNLAWRQWEPPEAACDNVKVIGLDDQMSCTRMPWHEYDAIFVDIAHRGPEEIAIHYALLHADWHGIVFWDDVSEYTDRVQKNPAPGMWGFWNCVRNEKKWTHWHDPVGFAVVRY